MATSILLSKLSIDKVDIKGKRVLMRVDFNVPMKDCTIINNQRIMITVPTIKYAMEHGAKAVILMSHLGKPGGKNNDRYSLRLLAEELKKLLGKEINVVPDCVGQIVEQLCENPAQGSIILLENLRFHIEEEGEVDTTIGRKIRADLTDIEAFQESLSRLGDIYVNDACTLVQHNYSSLVGVNLPVKAAGLHMKKELTFHGKISEKPERPLLAIIGGVKVADKGRLIDIMLDRRVNEMIIVGPMAITFLEVINNAPQFNNSLEILKYRDQYASRHEQYQYFDRNLQQPTGMSLFDEQGSRLVFSLMMKAILNRVKITLPVDFITGDLLDDKATVFAVPVSDVINGEAMGLDIGPQSIKLFSDIMLKCKTIMWNGPPGLFELDNFSKGTQGILNACIAATKNGSTVVVGGVDTAAAVAKWKAEDKISHISTLCSSSLEQILAGVLLPAIAHLSDA